MGLAEIKAYQTSVKFASSYIVTLFGAACLGYYLGSEIFELTREMCWALSGIMIFVTLVCEVLLFIIKEERGEVNRRKVMRANKSGGK